jgi:hypothetical protein
MTDVEFYMLSVLFERKLLSQSDLNSLIIWVDEHDLNGTKFANPTELIEILDQYPDRF